jgi:hypothetical protein
LSVCLEINNVYLIKTKKSDNQADVGLIKRIACYVPLFLKNFINPVKRFCELGDGLVIGFLRLRKPTFIDPVVDGMINAFIHSLHHLDQTILVARVRHQQVSLCLNAPPMRSQPLALDIAALYS